MPPTANPEPNVTRPVNPNLARHAWLSRSLTDDGRPEVDAAFRDPDALTPTVCAHCGRPDVWLNPATGARKCWACGRYHTGA
jgi:hypothetical protein